MHFIMVYIILFKIKLYKLKLETKQQNTVNQKLNKHNYLNNYS